MMPYKHMKGMVLSPNWAADYFHIVAGICKEIH